MSVTVVGSLNEDVLVAVGRLPGRGETVIGRSAELAPGGKGANQAAAAGRLGPGVHMVGRVGEDPAGDRQLAALADSRVNVGRVHRTPGVPTGSATIPVEDGSGENLIVVVPGANAELTPEDADVESVHRAAVLLLQLEVPMETVLAAARAATGTVVLTPAPPQPLPAELLEHVDVLVPNEHELAQLAGAEPGERRPRELAELARSVASVRGRGDARRARRPGGARRRRARCCRRRRRSPPSTPPAPATASAARWRRRWPAATDLPGAVRYAVAAAALSTTGPGARGALPDDDAVQALLPRTPAAAGLG